MIVKLLQKFIALGPKGQEALNAQAIQMALSAGSSLTLGQVAFVRNNIQSLPDFLATPEGNELVKKLVEGWMQHK